MFPTKDRNAEMHEGVSVISLVDIGRATGSDASLTFFSTSRGCSRNRSPSRLPVSPMYSFLHNVQVMQ